MKVKNISASLLAITAGVALLSSLLAPGLTQASSHREAPLIAADPQVDSTDLYAFVSPDKSNTVTFIANYRPFESPAGGPNFYKLDDNALYEIKIDNDGDGVEDISYQFTFNTTTANTGTFLYNTGPVNSLGDATLNVKQFYTLTKVDKKTGASTVLVANAPVAPNNVGPKSMPNYASLAAQAVQNLSDGTQAFVGPVDDPFFADLGGIFDLLTIRKLPGDMGGGHDYLAGYNVHTLALQVPIEQLTINKNRPTTVADGNSVIGVWTTASRRATRVLSAGSTSHSGDWVQVSRLGAPLVNEAVIPRAGKDVFNGSQPKDDAQFANYVTDPELGKLFKALYNINVPPQGAFGSSTQRDDLIAIFVTGIKGVTQPANPKPAEELRLNVAVPPTANPNIMGVLGGDNQGYPNGRRLADDVTDISLRAVAGAAYPLFHPDFKPDPIGVRLGDGVDANDKAFRSSFPYVALPNDGYTSYPSYGGSGAYNYTPSGSTGGSSMYPPAAMCSCGGNGLHLGSRGAGVTTLQTCLRGKGLLHARPTGFFGGLTQTALQACKY